MAQLDDAGSLGDGLAELAHAEPWIVEARVVAELGAHEAERAPQHVIEGRLRHEAIAPASVDLAQVHAVELLVVRDHEGVADGLAEPAQAIVLERHDVARRCREVRRDEVAHACEGDLFRQAEGVRLERILADHAVRVDAAPTFDLEPARLGQGFERPALDRIAAEVEQVPGAIEAITSFLDGDGEAADLLAPLHDAVRHANPAQLARSGEAGEPCAENDDGPFGGVLEGHADPG
jgi:hypothetical protein